MNFLEKSKLLLCEINYLCRKKMIQRIQTVYLVIVLISVVILNFGTPIFNFEFSDKNQNKIEVNLNSYGKEINVDLTNSNDEVAELLTQNFQMDLVSSEIANDIYPISNTPYYIITIVLSLLTLATIIQFKKLEKQIKTGRLLFVALIITDAIFITLYYLTKSEMESFDLSIFSLSSTLGIGYYLLIIATAFSFLANIGIKKDLNLIKSIDRIR